MSSMSNLVSSFENAATSGMATGNSGQYGGRGSGGGGGGGGGSGPPHQHHQQHQHQQQPQYDPASLAAYYAAYAAHQAAAGAASAASAGNPAPVVQDKATQAMAAAYAQQVKAGEGYTYSYNMAGVATGSEPSATKALGLLGNGSSVTAISS